jgi:hypothetical protein
MSEKQRHLDEFVPHEPQDAAVEVMLGEHLNARLNGQVGKASAAFQQQMNRELHARELKRTRRAWYLAAIPTGLAACIAVMATISYMKPPAVDAKKGAGATVAAADSPKVESTTYYRDFDGGVRMVSSENGPRAVRQIRRQVVQETEWYDPQEKATMRVTVPAEQTVYVGVQPY